MSGQTPTAAEFLELVYAMPPDQRACVLACARRGNAGMPFEQNMAQLERELAEVRR
jgi:hypothetical protein